MVDLSEIKSTNELLVLALSNDKSNKTTPKVETEKIKTDFDSSKITSPGFLYLAAESQSRK